MICISDYLRWIVATKKPGEKLISGDGYYMIKTPKGYKGRTYIDGRYIYEHRYIMEKKLGRPLKYDENVHHKDGNKFNNSPSNLVLEDRDFHTQHTKPALKENRKKKAAVLDRAIKDIGTGHFDYGRTDRDRVVRILDPKAVQVVEGLFKKGGVKGYTKDEDATSWI